MHESARIARSLSPAPVLTHAIDAHLHQPGRRQKQRLCVWRRVRRPLRTPLVLFFLYRGRVSQLANHRAYSRKPTAVSRSTPAHQRQQRGQDGNIRVKRRPCMSDEIYMSACMWTVLWTAEAKP
jgi:hypothetical protein